MGSESEKQYRERWQRRQRIRTTIAGIFGYVSGVIGTAGDVQNAGEEIRNSPQGYVQHTQVPPAGNEVDYCGTTYAYSNPAPAPQPEGLAHIDVPDDPGVDPKLDPEPGSGTREAEDIIALVAREAQEAQEGARQAEAAQNLAAGYYYAVQHQGANQGPGANAAAFDTQMVGQLNADSEAQAEQQLQAGHDFVARQEEANARLRNEGESFLQAVQSGLMSPQEAAERLGGTAGELGASEGVLNELTGKVVSGGEAQATERAALEAQAAERAALEAQAAQRAALEAEAAQRAQWEAQTRMQAEAQARMQAEAQARMQAEAQARMGGN